MWARIENNAVVEIIPVDPAGHYHPSLIWAEIPEGLAVAGGDVWFEGEFYPKPEFAVEFGQAERRWLVDEEARLAALKRRKIEAIDAGTARLVGLGFEFAGKRFSMSEPAQRNWIALSSGLANGMLPFPLEISSLDESPRVLADADELKAFLAAYLQYQADPNAPLASGRALKRAAAAAGTAEEVEAILDNREDG